MNASRKLNVGPMPKQTENYEYAIETHYRWDRIVSALFLLVLFVALIVWFYRFLTAPAPTFATQPATAAQEIVSPPSASNNEVIPADSGASTKSTSVAVVDQQQSSQSETDFTAGSEDGATQSTGKEAASVTHPPAAVSDESVEDVTKKAKEKSQHKQFNVTMPRRNPVIEILDPAINIAQLTYSVKKGVPQDKLGGIIKMAPSGIIKLFLFNEVVNLKGSTLYHEWYLKGKRIARVKLPIYKNLKRTASSKFINRQMLGDWEVRVLDQNDKLYMKAHFKVIK